MNFQLQYKAGNFFIFCLGGFASLEFIFWVIFLGAFAKLQKVTGSFIVSVCMEQLGFHWMVFDET